MNTARYQTHSSLRVAFLEDLKEVLKNNDDARKLVKRFALERRLFCWAGYGFQMNSGVISLTSHNDTENSFMYFTTEDKKSIKEFLAPYALWQYRDKAAPIFARIVRERLNRFRPKLIICTGKAGDPDFKRIFLGEDKDKYKPIQTELLSKNENPRLNCSLYFCEETQTHIVICNFLTNRRPSTIRLADIPDFARLLRSVPELDWLEKLSPHPKTEAPRELMIKIDELLQDKDFDKHAFFADESVRALVDNDEAKAPFREQIAAIRPDAGLFAAPSTGDLFYSLLVKRLEDVAAAPASDEAKTALKAMLKTIIDHLVARKTQNTMRLVDGTL